MDDLISRQAAKEKLLSEGLITAAIYIDHLPALDPVKHGKWKLEEEQKHVELIYSCSECGYIAWGNEEISNYCPNCGANMGVGDD